MLSFFSETIIFVTRYRVRVAIDNSRELHHVAGPESQLCHQLFTCSPVDSIERPLRKQLASRRTQPPLWMLGW